METDFHLFSSYEAGRWFCHSNCQLCTASGCVWRPELFRNGPDTLYEMHVYNDGDAVEDITFQFRLQTNVKGLTLDIDGTPVAVPLKQIGPAATDNDNLNVEETYTANIVRGDRRTGTRKSLELAVDAAITVAKPVDNIGNNTIAIQEIKII